MQVILDKSQRTQKYTAADVRIRAGIRVLIEASHAIAQNKIMIVDNKSIMTGSFNFTKAAQGFCRSGLTPGRLAAVAHPQRTFLVTSFPTGRRRVQPRVRPTLLREPLITGHFGNQIR